MRSRKSSIARILACDPGLAAFGLAVLDVRASGVVTVHVARVITTVPTARKHGVLAGDDLERRADALARALDELPSESIDLVAIEAVSWPRNASAAAKTAYARGILRGMVGRDVPWAYVPPPQLKRALGAQWAAAADESTEDRRRHRAVRELIVNGTSTADDNEVARAMRRAANARKVASKRDVEAAVRARLDAASVEVVVSGYRGLKGLSEHAWDAVAVGLVALESEVGRAVCGRIRL